MVRVVVLVVLMQIVLCNTQMYDMSEGYNENLLCPCFGGPGYIGECQVEYAIRYPGGPDDGLVFSTDTATSCIDVRDPIEITENSVFNMQVHVPYTQNSETMQVMLTLDGTQEKLQWFKISGPIQGNERWIEDSWPLPQGTAPGAYNVSIWDNSRWNKISIRYFEITEEDLVTTTASTTDSSTASTYTETSTASTTEPSTASTTDFTTVSTTDSSTASTTDFTTVSTTDSSTASTTDFTTVSTTDSSTASTTQEDSTTTITDSTPTVTDTTIITTELITYSSTESTTQYTSDPTTESPTQKTTESTELSSDSTGVTELSSESTDIPQDQTTTEYSPPRERKISVWAIILSVLFGITVICLLTCCIWFLIVGWRRRRHENKPDDMVSLPRLEVVHRSDLSTNSSTIGITGKRTQNWVFN